MLNERFAQIRMIGKTHSGKLVAVIGCLYLFQVQVSYAIELYKYVNEDGVTVLDSKIPSKYVKSGYTIISSDGRVIEVVARALTEAEIIKRDRLAAKNLEEQEKKKLEAARDESLMRLYSTSADVIRVRDTKLASINSFINTARGRLQRQVEQKRELEALAADVERAGGTISQENVDRIRGTANRIVEIQKEIDSKLLEIETLREKYAKDLKRVRELYGEASS